MRVLVGASSHDAVPGLTESLRRLGAEPEVLDLTGVLAATVPSGAALVRALGGDSRVAYIERDRTLSTAQDPFDSVDATAGGSGIKYTWAYDEVGAATAIFAAGGGSRKSVAVLDTGVDVNHPELAGRVSRTIDVVAGTKGVADTVGHGTFVAGLIAAVDGNGVGGKGVAGDTKVIAVRASLNGGFTVRDLVRGIERSIARGADVLNMSLAGEGFSFSQYRALRAAFYNDVLPVAASGNQGRRGNPLEFPAAALGGERGRRGIGLSVTATRPGGAFADFSTHNRYVSLAAPGAGPSGCELGVFSTLPAGLASEWDDPSACSRLFAQAGARFAYGEGTSFAAPIASGLAALAWDVEPRLQSEQVADVLTRSARQTRGRGWNQLTGHGVVDGAAAVALAARYDVRPPPKRGKALRLGYSSVRVRIARVRDRTNPGHELAGRVVYSLLASRNNGGSYGIVKRSRRPMTGVFALKGTGTNKLAAAVCDRNGNCSVKRLGRYPR